MTLTSTPCRRITALCALLCSVGFTCVGCSRDAVGSPRLGATEPVEAIEPLAAPESSLDANAGRPRDEWPVLVVAAPRDPTTRLRSFTRPPALSAPSPRRRGLWPTPTSAATRDAPDAGLLAEMMLAPPLAGLDLLLLPARALAAPPEPRP